MLKIRDKCKSANMGSSTVQLNGVDLIDIQVQSWLLKHSFIIIIIIIIKKDRQCKAGRGRLTPYQSEDPSPTLPTYRGKEEKGK